MDLFFDSLNRRGVENYIFKLFHLSRIKDTSFEHVRILVGSGFRTRSFLISIHSNDELNFEQIVNYFLEAVVHVKSHGQRHFVHKDFMYIDLECLNHNSDLETRLFDIANTPAEVLDVSQMSVHDTNSYLREVLTDFYSGLEDRADKSTIYQALRYAFVRRVTTTVEGRLNK